METHPRLETSQADGTFDARIEIICAKAAAMDATDYLNPKTRNEHVARYITQGLHAL
ncbi:hypothetical protein OKW49_008462 [Paraburkholderia youngii]|uniref:hypothetical protein n=1 Tax=Paraburkholderia youngii TaxID=2782701 RepID=UPI003D1A7310